MNKEVPVFHQRIGRPVEYNNKERHDAQLEAKRKWRKKNKDRIAIYNKLHHEIQKGGTPDEILERIKKQSKHHSRHGSKHHSKHHSKHGSKRKHHSRH